MLARIFKRITNGTNTIAAFTWSSTYMGAAGGTAHAAVVAAGTMCFPSYGHTPQRQNDGCSFTSHWPFRQGCTALDLLDMFLSERQELGQMQ